MLITPKCPHCGKEVKIDVKKIDRLEAENLSLRQKLENAEAKKSNTMEDLFGDLFKKGKS